MSQELDPVVINLLYAALGGVMLIFFNWIAGFVFRTVMGYSVREEIKKGNLAVGLVMMGIFIGLGIGLGLVIGMGMN